MDRDPSFLLRDVKHSAEVILRITTGFSLARYSEDELVRPAVERHFEILGEALTRLRRANPELAARVCHAVADTRQVKSGSLFTGLNRSSASITA